MELRLLSRKRARWKRGVSNLQFSDLGSIHFLEGGWAGGIPMSMNVKTPSPPFIFFVKKCDPPPGSSNI